MPVLSFSRVAANCLHSVLLVASVGSLSAKEPRQIRETGGAFVGSVGCKSSSCHGGAGPKRSQYITWSQKDFHTKAYAVLLNSRSERMAESLGIGAAQSSARCTGCHSPMQSVAPSRLTRTAPPDEGVSCETCHGAAGGWLRGHTRTDWTYNTRVAAGMRDLKNLYVRANTCVACHQNLAPDLLKAGHPDLFFELDGQSVAQPKHWQDEEPWSGLRQWLTGGGRAARNELGARKRFAADTRSVARWDGLAWLCATATSAGSIPSPFVRPQTIPGGIRPGAKRVGRVGAPRVGLQLERRLRSNDAHRAGIGGRGIYAKGDDPVARPAREASRPRARSARQRAQSKPKGCLTIDSELNQLFEDVRTLDAFDASGFADHLQSLHTALENR